MGSVEIVIAVLLVILIAAVVVVGLRLGSGNPTPVATPIDPTTISVAVQSAINVDAIATGVRGAVEAQMRQTAQEALARNIEQANNVANQTLNAQKQSLDQQARALLQPLEERLNQLTKSVGDLHTTYTSEQATVVALQGQINSLLDSTTSLRNALKSPTARGAWGENQLRNVVSVAGMQNYCDYTEQFTGSENERLQRPDAVINLPTGGRLAVDAKAPLSAYLRMQDATDPAVQESELKQHAKDLRGHVKTLADKKYWEQFGHNTPDFVVMFIPGESFVADALKADTALMEDAMKMRVLIASPVNLLALLLTVAKGWQAQKLAEHAEQVARLGAELYDRVDTVLDSVDKVGNNLQRATNAYNTMVGSLESRLLVTMRKFRELDVVQGEVKELKPIELAPRPITAPELKDAPRELE